MRFLLLFLLTFSSKVYSQNIYGPEFELVSRNTKLGLLGCAMAFPLLTYSLTQIEEIEEKLETHSKKTWVIIVASNLALLSRVEKSCGYNLAYLERERLIKHIQKNCLECQISFKPASGFSPSIYRSKYIIKVKDFEFDITLDGVAIEAHIPPESSKTWGKIKPTFNEYFFSLSKKVNFKPFRLFDLYSNGHVNIGNFKNELLARNFLADVINNMELYKGIWGQSSQNAYIPNDSLKFREEVALIFEKYDSGQINFRDFTFKIYSKLTDMKLPLTPQIPFIRVRNLHTPKNFYIEMRGHRMQKDADEFHQLTKIYDARINNYLNKFNEPITIEIHPQLKQLNKKTELLEKYLKESSLDINDYLEVFPKKIQKLIKSKNKCYIKLDENYLNY